MLIFSNTARSKFLHSPEPWKTHAQLLSLHIKTINRQLRNLTTLVLDVEEEEILRVLTSSHWPGGWKLWRWDGPVTFLLGIIRQGAGKTHRLAVVSTPKRSWQWIAAASIVGRAITCTPRAAHSPIILNLCVRGTFDAPFGTPPTQDAATAWRFFVPTHPTTVMYSWRHMKTTTCWWHAIVTFSSQHTRGTSEGRGWLDVISHATSARWHHTASPTMVWFVPFYSCTRVICVECVHPCVGKRFHVFSTKRWRLVSTNLSRLVCNNGVCNDPPRFHWLRFFSSPTGSVLLMGREFLAIRAAVMRDFRRLTMWSGGLGVIIQIFRGWFWLFVAVAFSLVISFT